MDTLGLSVALCIIIIGIWFVRISIKSNGNIDHYSDFLSFGEPTEGKLERAFETTNTSFLTTFVSLFSFSILLGWKSIWMPISFCVGILFFNKVFLPRLMPFMILNKRYPQIISEYCKKPALRKYIAIFCIASFWLFTFSELQGFNLFISHFIFNYNWLKFLFPICLVIFLAIYTIIGGYKAVVDTDVLQMSLIYLMVISLFIGGIILFLLKYELKPNFLEAIELGNFQFVIPPLIGFLFSQVLYFDNWQRISYYTVEKAKILNIDIHKDHEVGNEFIATTIKKIKKTYNTGALILLIIYLVPIFFGLFKFNSSLILANDPIGTLFNVLIVPLYQYNHIVSYIFILTVISGFFSALISTADTYILSMVGLFVGDLLERDYESRDKVSNEINTNRLSILRIFTAVFAFSFLPMLFFHPRFDKLFDFMFFSINGMVGPIVCILTKRTLNFFFTLASILFGFIYTIIYLYTSYIPHPIAFFRNTWDVLLNIVIDPGFLTVVGSLSICLLGTKKILGVKQ